MCLHNIWYYTRRHETIKNGVLLYENIGVFLEDDHLLFNNTMSGKITKIAKIVDKETFILGLKELGKRLCEKKPNKEEYMNTLLNSVRNKNFVLSSFKGYPIPNWK